MFNRAVEYDAHIRKTAEVMSSAADDSNPLANRRPLTSRSTAWARFLAGVLVRSGLSPNAISLLSILFAAGGATLLVCIQNGVGLLAVAACVQLRLLCNLLDGMVAIEGKRRSPTGALYNEIPDRVADSLFIVALGYAIDVAWLGWFGALAAAVTAYIRVLGGSLGLPQDFRGPLAKPHRMAVLTGACVLGAIEWWVRGSLWALTAAAWIIAVGSMITCATRTVAIARQLRAR
jgi:phosphatidylglycerophosphate synthase